MPDTHPFRFGAVTSQIRTKQVLQETARQLEDSGFSTMLLTDHLGEDRLTAIPALVCAADATTTLRVGSIVLNNDLRHPAVLAGEIATVDVVTDGRFELGIGAGWEKEDYDRAGIQLDPAPVRIRRMEESINILTAFFGGDVVNFSGEFYTVTDMPAVPTTHAEATTANSGWGRWQARARRGRPLRRHHRRSSARDERWHGPGFQLSDTGRRDKADQLDQGGGWRPHVLDRAVPERLRGYGDG